MSRVLLTWELGLNVGHLARLLPLAVGLQKRGHSVLVAVREIPAAAAILGPHGIAFVQAPHLSQPVSMPDRVSGYADVLLSYGWNDPQTLWGLTDSWCSLMRMFRPDMVVLDHSPAALLAVRIEGTPALLVGNGFEVPPSTDPLPPFPGFSWATADRSAVSERRALNHANQVLARLRRPGLSSLGELFQNAATFLVTFPELDHYEDRQNARYVGPLIASLGVEAVEWPPGRRRIFAALRPDTENLDAILAALRLIDVSVVCFAPGFTPERLGAHAHSQVRFFGRLINLKPLLDEADLCISYGAEGTLISFLLSGVPQLISAGHIETQMTARRIENLGAGLTLSGRCTPQKIATAIEQLTEEPRFKQQSLVFSQRYGSFDSSRAARELTDFVGARLG